MRTIMLKSIYISKASNFKIVINLLETRVSFAMWTEGVAASANFKSIDCFMGDTGKK